MLLVRLLLLVSALAAGQQVGGAAPLVSIALQANGADVSLHHYAGADVDAEVAAFCQQHGLSTDTYAAQLMGMVNTKLSELQGQGQGQQQPPQQQQQQPLFELSIKVGETDRTLPYYQGQTAADAATRFCAANGLDEHPQRADYISQLSGMISQRLEQQGGAGGAGGGGGGAAAAGASENGGNVAGAGAGAAAAAAAAAAGAAQGGGGGGDPEEGRLLFSLPVTMNGATVQLSYHEGQTALEATLKFCQAHGLGADPNLRTYIDQLQGMVQVKLAQLGEEEAAAAAGRAGGGAAGGGGGGGGGAETVNTPLFSLPITVNDTLHDLVYYEGQEPGAVATDFCGKKWTALQSSLSAAEADVELSECVTFLEETISVVRARLLDEVR